MYLPVHHNLEDNKIWKLWNQDWLLKYVCEKYKYVLAAQMHLGHSSFERKKTSFIVNPQSRLHKHVFFSYFAFILEKLRTAQGPALMIL